MLLFYSNFNMNILLLLIKLLCLFIGNKMLSEYIYDLLLILNLLSIIKYCYIYMSYTQSNLGLC